MPVRLTKQQAQRMGLEEPKTSKAHAAPSSAARVKPGPWRADEDGRYEVRDLGAGSSREYRDAPGYASGIPIDRTEWLSENKRKREER